MIWSQTKVSRLFTISLPIIQAPMAGGAASPELIAAVSNAGGLGSLAAGYMQAAEIRTAIHEVRRLTNKPFAVNLFAPKAHHASPQQIEASIKDIENASVELNWHCDKINPPYAPIFAEQLQVILEENIPIFSFAFGIPSDKFLIACKHKGIVLIGTATTLQEAKLLETKGVDAVVAQGSEAGGHRSTFLCKEEDALIGTLSLIPLVADHVKIPVIAAGGIMDGRGIAAALMLGAQGVQMGTAFLCCPESRIHPNYKETLLSAKKDATTLTRAFSGKLARGINNAFIQRMRAVETLDYPIQNALTSGMRKEAIKQGNMNFVSMWAGQGSHLCATIPAAELMERWKEDVSLLLPA